MTYRGSAPGKARRQAANTDHRGRDVNWRPAVLLLAVLLGGSALPAFATIFSTVKGVVHDPQHRPIPGAVVTLKAAHADWTNTSITNADGEFLFAAVPLGDYTVVASIEGFATGTQSITVVSGSVPILHVQLALAGVKESVTVSAAPSDVHPGSVTPTTLVSRQDIQLTPGADRTNGLEAITAFVPGAYVTHDQLHVRGGHQVSWLDRRRARAEHQHRQPTSGRSSTRRTSTTSRCSAAATTPQYGDRTYAVFNVVPRTGFERNNDADVTLSAGSYAQTNDRLSLGGHTERFAYFASANGEPQRPRARHAGRRRHPRSRGGRRRVPVADLQRDPTNQLRLVTSVRRDSYQVPNDPDDVSHRDRRRRAGVGRLRELLVGPDVQVGVLLTVSPFYHLNSANFDGGPNDPIVHRGRAPVAVRRRAGDFQRRGGTAHARRSASTGSTSRTTSRSP